MRTSLLVLVVLAACLVASAAPAWAEDPSSEIPLDQLTLELQPLQKRELTSLATAWVDHLAGSVRRANQIRIRLHAAKDEAARAPMRDELAAATSERTALAERTGLVLDALDRKGGDVDDHRKFLAAVSNVEVDLVEAYGPKEYLWAWFTSDEGGMRLLKKAGIFLLILLSFRFVAGAVAGVVRKSLQKLGRTPELLRNFLANTSRNVISMIGLVVALSQLGIDIGPMLAAIGGMGFVIGFALQSTLSNFASGVMILLYRPYEIGDAVTVAGVTGKVQAMTLVSTTIMTFDNKVTVVPNSTIWGDVITNATGSSTRRVDLVFGIGYDDDIAKAQGILEELATSHPKVMEQPETVVKVSTLNSSSVDFIVRPWCKTGDYWDVYWDLTRQVKERFDAEGISIPYPQTDVHIHQTAAAE